MWPQYSLCDGFVSVAADFNTRPCPDVVLEHPRGAFVSATGTEFNTKPDSDGATIASRDVFTPAGAGANRTTSKLGATRL